MGAFKLLLVLLVVYNNFNHAHSKSVDLTDSENERALLEVFSTILSSPETKNIETRSIEAEKIIFTDQEIAEVVAILKEKYPESASYVTEEMVKRKVNDVVPSAQYLIKFVFDGLRNVPREVDEERLKEVILQIMKEASELSFALKDEFGVEKSHIGVTAAPIAADAEAALPTVTLPPHLSYDLTLPPPSRSFQRDFIITPNQVRRALVHIHRRKLLRHGLLSSRNAPKIIAKQLNGLPPFAKLLTRTLLDNYYPSYFPSQPSHPGNNAVTLRESAHVPAMRVAGDEEVEDVPTGKVEHTDIIESDPSADETSEDETSENDFRPGHISGPRGDAEAPTVPRFFTHHLTKTLKELKHEKNKNKDKLLKLMYGFKDYLDLEAKVGEDGRAGAMLERVSQFLQELLSCKSDNLYELANRIVYQFKQLHKAFRAAEKNVEEIVHDVIKNIRLEKQGLKAQSPGSRTLLTKASFHGLQWRGISDRRDFAEPLTKEQFMEVLVALRNNEKREKKSKENKGKKSGKGKNKQKKRKVSKSEVQDLVLNLVKEIFSRHAVKAQPTGSRSALSLIGLARIIKKAATLIAGGAAIGKHVSDAVQHNDEVDKIKQERMRVSAGRTKAGKKLGKGVKDKGKGGKKPGKGGKKPGKGGKKPGKGGKKPGKGKNDKEKGGKKPGKDKGKGGKKPGKGEKKPGKGGKKPGKGGKKPGKGGKKPGKGGKKSKRNVEGEADFEAQ